MPNFLIEIYGEEIPPHAQIDGEKIFRAGFSNFLKEQKLSFNFVETFSSPRRITLIVNDIDKYKKEQFLSIRGPMVSASKKAVDGFLKSNKIGRKKDLLIKIVNEKEYYFYEKKINKISTLELLQEFLPILLKNFKWKTSMRWADFEQKWIRPIKSILCLFDKKIIKFNYCGISTSNYTFGNYLYSGNKIFCSSVKDYKEKLKKNYVIIDKKKRQEIIKKKLERTASKNNFFCNVNANFLEEISCLVEYPNILSGNFDKEFFSMPEFILTSVISNQQKYFSFRDNENNLCNLFSFVTNHKSDPTNRIIRGNEKVLKARFKDALFFIREDRLLKLEDRLFKLKEITYLEDLGNLYEKSVRLVKLSEYISKILNFKLDEKSKKIILISKTDLTSELVKEFPNLQGLVGSYYAELEGYSREQFNAIKEHYSPNHSNDLCPKSKLSICLSIADKIDQIIGVFLTGKKPSGSKDPFAIRRAALGIIRVLIENKIDMNLKILIQENYKLFSKIKLNEEFKIDEIMNFINVRLFIYLRENGISEGIFKSLITINEGNPYIIFYKANILSKFVATKKGKEFLGAYKRINSIIDKNIGKDTNVSRELFSTKEEKDLYDTSLVIKNKTLIKNFDMHFKTLIAEIQKLEPLINLFFDHVKVNVNDIKKKENRKKILIFSKAVIDKVCIFSFIE